MAKQQERAERTRRALVEAAAEEIDRNGYDRASLVRICQLAQSSMGALTFHFHTKGELADEVSAQGGQATRAAVGRVCDQGLPELEAVMELTLALARLLEQDARVRSAARLTREHPDTADAWTAAWLPEVGELLRRAYKGGQLRHRAGPAAVTVLVTYIMAGVEAYIRAVGATAAAEPDGAARQLERIWQLVLHGISAAHI
jgi:AcrR family transcriptional regulator